MPLASRRFWDWLKAHFVDMEFGRATHLVGAGYTNFIDELMPSHPLYTCLMSPEARGGSQPSAQPHSTRPADTGDRRISTQRVHRFAGRGANRRVRLS